MTPTAPPVVFLPGAGHSPPDLTAFDTGLEDLSRIEPISYPGWQRYVAEDFSAEVLIAELAEEIIKRVPEGPIRIVGSSIGGHFGYAAALNLQARGREIAGFCAIDTFMIVSSEPSAGWKQRALTQAWELISKGRIRDFLRFARSKFWRALLRLAHSHLPNLVRKFAASRSSASVSSVDAVLEDELSMRLLIRDTAPWIASLDREPLPLKAPAVLIRTQLSASDDAAWRRRCPNIEIHEVPGKHHSIFDPENAGHLRNAFMSATREWCAPNKRAFSHN